MSEVISPDEKVATAASLILLAPPKQIQEVAKDVKVICGASPNLDGCLNKALLKYIKEQNVQVTLPGYSLNTLISEYGELGNGKFLCPRTHNSFMVDPLSLAVDDVRPLKPDDGGGGSCELEPWRSALEDSLTEYIKQKFPHGAVSVFAPASSKRLGIYIFIESSIRKEVSSGRWKSSWVIQFPEKYKGVNLNVTGTIKVQTHIFEEGNVQLFSTKDFTFEALAKSPKELARDVSAKIIESEDDYQFSLGVSLDSMSATTFKALRRQLPMTRSKVEWNKIVSYQVGSEIARPN